MYNAIDLFCGCGGMTEGLKQAGFNVIAGVEIDENAGETYTLNHQSSGTVLFQEDIRKFSTQKILEILDGEPLHLLAGCPPCQGFSSLRRRNKKRSVKDSRNNLVLEYYRIVDELRPVTIMMENVPALSNYDNFKAIVRKLKKIGYQFKYRVENVADYGVPQRRKRLVLVGSLLGEINIAEGNEKHVTVRDIIGHLESVEETIDDVHKLVAKHSSAVQHRIELTPPDGGSRKDLPTEYTLACHKKEGVGFNDVYGRLRWDDVSSTITGGCLNPSKGRFLHPTENRCISAREAAMLQTFPRDYKFPTNIPRTAIALMIGNALPPEFCKQQARNIQNHLDEYFMSDIFDETKRSEIMSHVKNKGTDAEIQVRKILVKLGFGHYRLNTKKLPFSPDIVFPGMKKVIFVNGCFWHGHTCSRGKLPQSNTEFWINKIELNKERDAKNYSEIERLGWTYLVIWQCEIKCKNDVYLSEKINHFMNNKI